MCVSALPDAGARQHARYRVAGWTMHGPSANSFGVWAFHTEREEPGDPASTLQVKGEDSLRGRCCSGESWQKLRKLDGGRRGDRASVRVHWVGSRCTGGPGGPEGHDAVLS